MPTIEDVRQFWNENPLWTGESAHPPGSKEFFEEHRTVWINDGMAGTMDPRMFPASEGSVLDLGCGVGFWLPEFFRRGYNSITAADISSRSLEIARRRCEVYGIKADLSEQNAEATSFPSDWFDHVNCIGVVHHTTNPAKAVREIHRVLKPGGTAVVAVYYKNIVLRNFGLFKPFIAALAFAGAKLKGRGREGIYRAPTVDEIVRVYDGDKNPIGLAYDRAEFAELVGPGFVMDEVFFHFFPARSLPFPIPRWAHRILDRRLPFMIYARLTKTA